MHNKHAPPPTISWFFLSSIAQLWNNICCNCTCLSEAMPLFVYWSANSDFNGLARWQMTGQASRTQMSEKVREIFDFFIIWWPQAMKLSATPWKKLFNTLDQSKCHFMILQCVFGAQCETVWRVAISKLCKMVNLIVWCRLCPRYWAIATLRKRIWKHLPELESVQSWNLSKSRIFCSYTPNDKIVSFVAYIDLPF